MDTPKIDFEDVPLRGLIALREMQSDNPLGARDWVRAYSGLQPAEVAQLSTKQVWNIIAQVSEDVLSHYGALS